MKDEYLSVHYIVLIEEMFVRMCGDARKFDCMCLCVTNWCNSVRNVCCRNHIYHIDLSVV